MANQELLGVLLGGGLTVVGGFAGTAYLRWRDVRREQQEERSQVIAAIRIVHLELARNLAFLRGVIDNKTPASIDLSEASYNQVQLVLARHLPQEVRSAVLMAYAGIVPTANDIFAHLRHQMPRQAGEIETLKMAFERLVAADRLLHDHLTKKLRAEV